jgi:hypothetical protein
MATIKVSISKISAKTTNGNYIHTLKTEGVEHEVLGKKIVTGKRTYFLALTESAVLGSEHSIDLDKFAINESDAIDRKTGDFLMGDNGKPMRFKYLNFK